MSLVIDRYQGSERGIVLFVALPTADTFVANRARDYSIDDLIADAQAEYIPKTSAAYGMYTKAAYMQWSDHADGSVPMRVQTGAPPEKWVETLLLSLRSLDIPQNNTIGVIVYSSVPLDATGLCESLNQTIGKLGSGMGGENIQANFGGIGHYGTVMVLEEAHGTVYGPDSKDAMRMTDQYIASFKKDFDVSLGVQMSIGDALDLVVVDPTGPMYQDVGLVKDEHWLCVYAMPKILEMFTKYVKRGPSGGMIATETVIVIAHFVE